MKELIEYRRQLIDRLAEAAIHFREACLAVKDPHAPLEPEGWSAHQMAAHVRDVHTLVYGARPTNRGGGQPGVQELRWRFVYGRALRQE